jgi:single-strand DNA-binding protein
MINKAILIGRLGNDPKITKGVATISLATTSSWTDKESGEKQTNVEWHKVVFFKKLAEIVNQYLHKGALIFVEGMIKTEKWTDKNDIERYTTKIIANNMQMLGSKKDQQKEFSQEDNRRANEQQRPQNDFYDDDIPF